MSVGIWLNFALVRIGISPGTAARVCSIGSERPAFALLKIEVLIID
jgi:hypothetical protein